MGHEVPPRQYQKDHPVPCTQLIELAVQLHQVRCCSIQINQTQTAYQSVESLSCSFHNSLLYFIQQCFKIGQYYNG
ncbi:hypothetical protein VP01_506g3 [Puccinia sorghi]|uniref:Uncharacterized protein n=1 Tax=Puccinia sorghi TaxID=27349 RepID=A0A0L6UNH6_9BASI|nr:hypothetical protein VP01_506g3 [Puccinia sorghi]